MHKYNIFLMVFLLFFSSCSNTKQVETQNSTEKEYILKKVSFEELQSVIHKDNDTLYLVNFWATWCRPCIEELPDFMEVNKKFKETHKFKMILVSLDNRSVFEETLPAFLKAHEIEADVYLLDDITRMNEWIPAIDSSWTGAIPATVFYKNKEKLSFYEKPLHKEELTNIIKPLL